MLLVQATVVAQPAPFQAGDTWEGSYTCGRLRAATLRIDEVSTVDPRMPGAVRLRGLFSFGGEGLPSGSYTVDGSVVQGVVKVEPGAWVVRPGQYVAVGFSGRLSGDGTRLDANVQGPGCSTLTMTRTGRQAPTATVATAAASLTVRALFGLEIGDSLPPQRCTAAQLWSAEHRCAVPATNPEEGVKSPDPLPVIEGEFSMTPCGRGKPTLAKDDPAHVGCTAVSGRTREGRIVSLGVKVPSSPSSAQKLMNAFGPAEVTRRPDDFNRGRERVVQRWWLPGYQRLMLGCTTGEDDCQLSVSMRPPDAAQLALLQSARTTRRVVLANGAASDADMLAAWPAGVAWEPMTAFAIGPTWIGADAAQRQALSQLFPELVVAAQRAAFKLMRQDAELVLLDYGFPAVDARREFICRQLNVRPCVPMALKLSVRGTPPGSGELIYEVIEAGGAWRVVDFQIGGISLLATYQQQFAAEIRNTGLNGLIAKLGRRQR